MFYGLENGTRRDDICSMCDDRLQPTKWKMAQAALLFILKDSAQLCEQVFADIKSCLHEGWLTRALNLYSTGRGKGLTCLAPPLCAATSGGAAFTCRLRLGLLCSADSVSRAFGAVLLNKAVELKRAWPAVIGQHHHRREGLGIGSIFTLPHSLSAVVKL